MKKIVSLILTLALFATLICSFSTVYATDSLPAYTVDIYNSGNSVSVKVSLPEDIDIFAGNSLFVYNKDKLTLVSAESLINGVVNPNYVKAEEGVDGGVMHTFASTSSFTKGAEVFVMNFDVADGKTFNLEDIDYYRFQLIGTNATTGINETVSSSTMDGAHMNFNLYHEVNYADESGYVFASAWLKHDSAEIPVPSLDGCILSGLIFGEFVDAPETVTSCVTITCTFMLYGDVNDDGKVTPLDASLVLQYNAQLIKELKNVQGADVNGDGKVTPLDASLILQYNAQLIPALPTK